MDPISPSNPFAKRYSEAFKQEALLLLASGRSQAQVSRELNVSSWSLSQWKKAAAGASLSKDDASTAELLAEVASLRKQLARSELREDILKKALSILGQEPTNVSK